MLRHRAVWAIILNNFTFHYAFYVVMNWLPTYFDKAGFPNTRFATSYASLRPSATNSYQSCLQVSPGVLIPGNCSANPTMQARDVIFPGPGRLL